MPRRPGEAAVVFTVASDAWIDPLLDAEDLRPAQWPGASTATIPAGAERLLLWGHHDGLLVGDQLALVQGSVSEVVEIAAVELANEPGWVADPGDALSTAEAEVTRVSLSAALRESFRAWDEDQPLTIHANLVEARAGALRRAVLPSSASATLRREEVLIRLGRNTAVVARDGRSGAVRYLLRALRVPEAPLLWDLDEDGEQVPALRVEIDGEAWTREPHLHRSRAYDQHYTVSTDNEGGLWLHFGDDRRGRGVVLELEEDGAIADAVPALELVLEYRVGQATAGNIALGKLSEIVPPVDPESPLLGQLAALGELALVNVTPASGGREGESLDAIRETVTASLRSDTLERAVTLADYAKVAEQADPRVERAAARALGGVFNTVMVLVDEREAETLSDELRAVVEDACERMRMTGREVVVRGPDYVPLDVELALCADIGVPRHRLRARVLAALRPGSADAPGWFHPDSLSFGQDLELGELLAFVQRLPGVRSVKALRFRPLREPPGVEVPQRIQLAPAEVARLDADDLRPENGRLRVRVVGLEPDLDSSAWDIEQPLEDSP
nr:baseplate J/gp47 family protein [Pseudenhygromyxa sp. WMMC2535]